MTGATLIPLNVLPNVYLVNPLDYSTLNPYIPLMILAALIALNSCLPVDSYIYKSDKGEAAVRLANYGCSYFHSSGHFVPDPKMVDLVAVSNDREIIHAIYPYALAESLLNKYTDDSPSFHDSAVKTRERYLVYPLFRSCVEDKTSRPSAGMDDLTTVMCLVVEGYDRSRTLLTKYPNPVIGTK